jgi:hypothetical protein
LDEGLDTLARAIHANFVEERLAEGRSREEASLQDWDRLSHDLRESNRQQADHIPVKLRAICCTCMKPSPDAVPVTEFSEMEVELLARMEHDRWVAERRLAGWRDGPRDTSRRTTPHLADWTVVPASVQEYDRGAVRQIPALLDLVGEKVYRHADGPSGGACGP